MTKFSSVDDIDQIGINTGLDFRASFDWEGVIEPITDDQVRAWVTDLRSGNYEQGRRYLSYTYHGLTCFCCLGVLGETKGVLETMIKEDYAYLIVDACNEQSVYYLPRLLQRHLANLNDESQNTFEVIADYIEKGFKLGKEEETTNS
jgi:hypothetical protein